MADVPMAEFWSHFGEINTDWSVVESTSVGHTNGRTIIAAEAFTAEFPERWLQHPASMKNQGDWAFCAGINRIVFHRFQSQSGTDRSPGMTMGPDGGYGVHWDRTQTWWDMAHGLSPLCHPVFSDAASRAVCGRCAVPGRGGCAACVSSAALGVSAGRVSRPARLQL